MTPAAIGDQLAAYRADLRQVERRHVVLTRLVADLQELLMLDSGLTLVEQPPAAPPLLEAPKASLEDAVVHVVRPALAARTAAKRSGRPAVQHDLPIPGWRKGMTALEQGRALLAYRKSEGLSQQGAVDRLGVSKPWWNKREALLPAAERREAALPPGKRPAAAPVVAPKPPAPKLPVLSAALPAVQPAGDPLPPLRKTPVTPGDFYIDWGVTTLFGPFLAWWQKTDKPTRAAWDDHLRTEALFAGKPHTQVPPGDAAQVCYRLWRVATDSRVAEAEFMRWYTATADELGYPPQQSQFQAWAKDVAA